MKKTSMILIIVIMFGISACITKPALDETFNVERVFRNSPSHYTLFEKRGGELIPREIWSVKKSRIITDVPYDQPMWAIIHYAKYNSYWYNPEIYLEIHIHSAKNIGGGETQTGKNQTTPIQVIE